MFNLAMLKTRSDTSFSEMDSSPLRSLVVSDSLVEHFEVHVRFCPSQQSLHVLLVKGQRGTAILNRFFQLFQLKREKKNKNNS